MEGKTIYYISEASKLVQVEPHVLRYWEDELALPIGRNEMGHRSYTQEDIERFRRIKHLKEQGLQLRAIRMVLHGEYAFPTADNAEDPKHEEAVSILSGKAPLSKGGEIEKTDPYEVAEHEMQEKVEDMIMKKAKKYMVTMTKGKETVMELPGKKCRSMRIPPAMKKQRRPPDYSICCSIW